MIRVDTKPNPTVTVNLYMLICQHPDDKIEDIYEEIEELILHI